MAQRRLTRSAFHSSRRRPFDLGDRIPISNPNDRSGDNDPGYDDAWLVEDCNLFTTTLRLARTNEVAYLNNGMLSNCKIINHGRSINAMINLLIPIRLEATHEQVQIVKSSLVSWRTLMLRDLYKHHSVKLTLSSFAHS
jgi:small-conductance mechanosensitive channel